MTRASDKALLRRYHEQGDLAAREQLIEQYLSLVRSLARRYAYRGEQLDDLVQIGCIGLIKAIDRFDIDRGVELTTYATPNIIGEIKRHFRDKGWAVRVPRGLQELNVQLSKIVEDQTVQLGRSPTIPELAKAAGVEEELVLEALESGRAYTSLSLSAGGSDEDGELDPLESLGTEEHQYSVSEDRAVLAPGFRVLDERERRILHLRFFDGLTQSQIAQHVGISQMHVSRLIRRALEKIRDEIATDRAARGTGAQAPGQLVTGSAPYNPWVRTSAELREGFLAFMEEKGHKRLPSWPLVPRADDHSTLLTTAGMQPQMPFFLGREEPPALLTATSQKCFRTPDIDEVGNDGHHLTFFEMLGNFSFGQYFKHGRDRAREGVHHRAPRARLGPDLGDRPRRRPRLRARAGRGRDQGVGGRRDAAGAHRRPPELGELLVGRRPRAVRARLGDLLGLGRRSTAAATRRARRPARAATASSSSGTSSSWSTSSIRTGR